MIRLLIFLIACGDNAARVPADAAPAPDSGPRLCAAQSDCPRGMDCGLAHAGDTMTTCYPQTYGTAAGEYGTSCAIALCTGMASPCTASFTCEAAHKCDPDATCIAACTTDTDCPPTRFCAPDGMCRARGGCEPCVIDDQCGAEARCVTDPNGERYCAKTCASDADCPQPEVNANTGATAGRFSHCIGGACEPASGFCHGDGKVCATCRADFPGDCATGEKCFESFTTERFCSQACTVDVTVAGTGFTTANDSCPAGSYCFFGNAVPCSTTCTVMGGCAADPAYQFFTCYP